MKAAYIGQAWLVLVLAGVFGLGLGGVYVGLGPKIRQNRRNEVDRQIPKLVPGAAPERTTEMTIGEMQVYKAAGSDGEHLGWVIQTGGQGYAGRIDLLVGLDPAAERISGIYVLSQTETPGLGNHVADSDWRGQFAGKTATEPVEVTRHGPAKDNEVVVITGATISSGSVCSIVNEAVREFRSNMPASE